MCIKTMCFVTGILCLLFLQGCATEPLQAPCNNSANQCAPTVKINQWAAT